MSTDCTVYAFALSISVSPSASPPLTIVAGKLTPSFSFPVFPESVYPQSGAPSIMNNLRIQIRLISLRRPSPPSRVHLRPAVAQCDRRTRDCVYVYLCVHIYIYIYNIVRGLRENTWASTISRLYRVIQSWSVLRYWQIFFVSRKKMDELLKNNSGKGTRRYPMSYS